MRTHLNEKFEFLVLPTFAAFCGICTLVSALADAPVVPAGSSAPATLPGTNLGAAQAPGLGSMLLPFAAMFAVVYFLMIRPQQKKAKEQQEMLGQLKTGDEVVTTAGILGSVKGITEKVVTLEIDSGVKMKVLKSQVTQVVKGQI